MYPSIFPVVKCHAVNYIYDVGISKMTKSLQMCIRESTPRNHHTYCQLSILFYKYQYVQHHSKFSKDFSIVFLMQYLPYDSACLVGNISLIISIYFQFDPQLHIVWFHVRVFMVKSKANITEYHRMWASDLIIHMYIDYEYWFHFMTILYSKRYNRDFYGLIYWHSTEIEHSGIAPYANF